MKPGYPTPAEVAAIERAARRARALEAARLVRTASSYLRLRFSRSLGALGDFLAAWSRLGRALRGS